MPPIRLGPESECVKRFAFHAKGFEVQFVHLGYCSAYKRVVNHRSVRKSGGRP
jgi:hypothetical protein